MPFGFILAILAGLKPCTTSIFLMIYNVEHLLIYFLGPMCSSSFHHEVYVYEVRLIINLLQLIIIHLSGTKGISFPACGLFILLKVYLHKVGIFYFYNLLIFKSQEQFFFCPKTS